MTIEFQDNSSCVACAAPATCLLPAEASGAEGAPLPACWRCAHVVTEHETAPGLAGVRAASRACTCPASEIEPAAPASEIEPEASA